MTQLSLAKAIQSGRLEEFAAQAEASGVGPISEATFDTTASSVIKTPLQDDQTSDSLRPDGSREK